MKLAHTLIASAALLAGVPALAQTVYSNDFDAPATVGAGVTAGFADAGGGLQGTDAAYSAYGSIFRNSTTGMTELTLSGLGAHAAVDIGFVLAFLDSWDSVNGSPAPDWLDLYIDGVKVASFTYNNASGSTVEIGGGSLIATATQFDVNYFYTDTVVDMAGALSFAHSASALTIGWQASGAGWQGGTDEAWGIDNLSVNLVAVPEPGTTAMLLAGLAGMGAVARRRRT